MADTPTNAEQTPHSEIVKKLKNISKRADRVIENIQGEEHKRTSLDAYFK